MEKYKLLHADSIGEGDYLQQYCKDGEPYCRVIKFGNPSIEITYYRHAFGINNESFIESYKYAKISEYSFNRIKRIVMKKLGI